MEISFFKNNNKDKWLVPGAIVIAGVLVSLSVLYVGMNRPAPLTDAERAIQESLKLVRQVDPADHARGATKPKVTIVEYSDTECPFCKQFHKTLKDLVLVDGTQVSWVYRHFPLDVLHSNARKQAVALECAGEQGGNDAFWNYTDKIYEITPSNNRLDMTLLPKIAKDLGLDVSKFNECLSSGRFDSKIQKDAENAVATGGQGTPWSVVIGKGGKKYYVGGAMKPAELKLLIERASKGK